MFPSFTGSARPRRQVNLSGRNNNPFAALPGSRSSSSPQSTPNALAQAQQERILRQQERERPPAATIIQKTWRGYKERREAMKHWRQEWDHKEEWDPETLPAEPEQSLWQSASALTPYASEGECLSSLRLLVQFASPHNEQDVQRLSYFASRYFRSMPMQPSVCPPDVWTHPLLRLAKLSLATLTSRRTSPLSSFVVDGLLALLHSLAATIPKQLALYSYEYFRTLTEVAIEHQSEDVELIKTTIVGLLKTGTSRTSLVYEGFASEFLVISELPTIFGSLEGFARAIRYEALANALNQLLSPSSQVDILRLKSRESLLWLLAYFIYFRRWVYSEKHRATDLPDAQYVNIVSRLISYLADDIGARIDATGDTPLTDGMPTSSERAAKPLPTFVRSEIMTLINQENVSSLLANIDVVPASDIGTTGTPNEPSAVASYALTLLRAFPRRGDEIRMWLYRGSTSRQAQTARVGANMPAIKFFYRATSRTNVFEKISKDPHETVSMLRPDKVRSQLNKSSSSITAESRDQQWRVILLFLELYTFVLKVMDDEEFLSGTSESNIQWSWTRQSALPLDQVKELTIFLKNLAFSMHWNTTKIAGIESTEAKTSLAEYFGGSKTAQPEKGQDESPTKFAEMSVAGVSGMTLGYMKGMVTGVLRMIYERE